jgi:SOS response regulatory protein OraA/RecX
MHCTVEKLSAPSRMDKKPSGQKLPRKGDGGDEENEANASESSLAIDQARYGCVNYGVSSGTKKSPKADQAFTSNNAYQAPTESYNNNRGDKLKSPSSVGYESSLEFKQLLASPSVNDSRSSGVNNMDMLQQNKNAKRKRPKDEIEKPKRPRTAYNYFVRDERKRIMEHHRQSQALRLTNKENAETSDGEESDDPIRPSFENIGKTIGERWKNISPDMRAHYDAMAREDGRRYQRDMALYNAALDSSMEPRLSKPGSALLACSRVGDQHQDAGGGRNVLTRPSSDGVPASFQVTFASAISSMQQHMNNSFYQASGACSQQDLQAMVVATLQQQQGHHHLQQQHQQVQPILLLRQLQANLQHPPGNLANLLSQLTQAQRGQGQAPQAPGNGVNGLPPQIAQLVNALVASNERGVSAGGGLVGHGQKVDQQNAVMSQQMQTSGRVILGSDQQKHADQSSRGGGGSSNGMTQNPLNLPPGLSELVNEFQQQHQVQQRAASSVSSVNQQQVNGAQSALMNVLLQQQIAASAVSSNQQVQANGGEPKIDPQQLRNLIDNSGNAESFLQQMVSQLQGQQQHVQTQIQQQARAQHVQTQVQAQQQQQVKAQAQQQAQQKFLAMQQLQQMQQQLQRQGSSHSQQGGAHPSAQQQATGLLMQALSSIPAGGGNNNNGAILNAFAAPQQQDRAPLANVLQQLLHHTLR